jgi:acyl carrier protein
VIAEVLSRIAPEADIHTLGGDEDIREALDLDSMDFLNLVIGVHARTGIDIPEADYPLLFTLNGAVVYLCGKTPA